MNGSIHQDKRSGKFSIKLYLGGKQVCILRIPVKVSHQFRFNLGH